MLRTVSDALSESLLESFPPQRPYSPSDFRRPPMPAPTAHYLEKVISWNLEDVASQLRHLSADWFDDKDDDVLRARDAFRDTITEHAYVPQHEWRKQLTEAVRRTLHFLVEPAPALADFAYQGINAELPVSLIQKRIVFFSPYSYLRDAASVYFENKGLRKIDRDRFLEMLRQVDRRMTRDYTPDDWVNLLDPLFTYMQPAPSTDGDAVPVTLLADFFEEKNAAPIVQQLKQYVGQEEGEPALTARDLKNMIENTPEESSETPRRAETNSAPEKGARTASSGNEAVPLWKKFRNNPHHEPRQPSSPSPLPEPTSATTAARPRWQQFRAAPADNKNSAGSANDLDALERNVVGDRGRRNRRLFVKHLFGGSEEAYQEALEQLSTADAWPQASRIIAQEVFQKHRVNIYSDEAISFTDAVEAQFSS